MSQNENSIPDEPGQSSTDGPAHRVPEESPKRGEGVRTGANPGTVTSGSTAAAAKRGRPWYIEVPILIVIALVLSFFIQTFLGRVYLIPSESMEPTLHGCAGCDGDRIVVDKVTYHFRDPKPGDVVVFKGPDSWNAGYESMRSKNSLVRALQNAGAVVGIVPPDENDLVKRVIATEGQTVGGCSQDNRLLVDGSALSEPYVFDNGQPPNPGNCQFGPVTVPDGTVWVMGDNRSNSADSRFHMSDERQGAVPVDNIIGIVRGIILPVKRFGSVDNPDIKG